MSKSITTIIVSIEYRLRLLIDRNAGLEQRNTELESELERLELELRKQKEIIEELEEEIRIYKLGEAINNKSSDIREVKLKINELVRKIDRSIDIIKEEESK